MSAANNFRLVGIITVFNVMQEVMDTLIFVYISHLHLHLPCIDVTIHIISKTLERNFGTVHVVGIQVWRQSSCGYSMYSWSLQMRALCPSKVLEASSGAKHYIYDGRLHLLPAMHPSIEHVNGLLPVSFSQQNFRIVPMPFHGGSSHCLTHRLGLGE